METKQKTTGFVVHIGIPIEAYEKAISDAGLCPKCDEHGVGDWLMQADERGLTLQAEDTDPELRRAFEILSKRLLASIAEYPEAKRKKEAVAEARRGSPLAAALMGNIDPNNREALKERMKLWG